MRVSQEDLLVAIQQSEQPKQETEGLRSFADVSSGKAKKVTPISVPSSLRISEGDLVAFLQKSDT